MSSKVAVIGAGMAGLAAARLLSAAGIAVSLFDKGRGIGGRAATRRSDGWQFDHGLRCIEATAPNFVALVGQWRQQGQVEDWGALTIGTPAMNAPLRWLAADLDVRSSCQIAALSREGRSWRLIGAEGSDSPPDLFDAVILAVPAPQVGPLALTAGISFAPASQVRYAPCWTVMLGFEQMLDLPPYRLSTGKVAWMARESSKPGRASDREALVIQADAEWSRSHLEMSGSDVAKLLWRETALAAEPLLATAHRWRYALVERPAGVPFLWDQDRLVGACGDWCQGPGLEAAFLSGEAMAEQVLRAGLT